MIHPQRAGQRVVFVVVISNTRISIANVLSRLSVQVHNKQQVLTGGDVIVVVVVSRIQRIGCQPEKNYSPRWPIPLVVC